MRIKEKPNRKKVMVEFDEFYDEFTISNETRANAIHETAKDFGGVRKAYNMWEFDNIESVEKFIFMYNLKHAYQSKKNRQKV